MPLFLKISELFKFQVFFFNFEAARKICPTWTSSALPHPQTSKQVYNSLPPKILPNPMIPVMLFKLKICSILLWTNSTVFRSSQWSEVRRASFGGTCQEDVLKRWRQKDQEFEVSLGHTVFKVVDAYAFHPGTGEAEAAVSSRSARGGEWNHVSKKKENQVRRDVSLLIVPATSVVMSQQFLIPRIGIKY